MSFAVAFIAKSRTGALGHVAQLREERRLVVHGVPDTVLNFVADALTNMRHEGPVAVQATGHLCTPDGRSYEVSNLQLEIKPLGAEYVDA